MADNYGKGHAALAREYREKYGQDMATSQLARIMYNDNKLTFDSVEQARNRLLYIEGKTGKQHKATKTVSESKFFKSDARPINPYNLPDSHQEDRSPFVLPVACNNILLISDLHIPYHDINAITIALDYGKKEKVNTIFINGDLIDFHGASRFEKDPRKRSIKQEFDATREFLEILRATFPKASIYWLKGNHCIRWEKFLLAKVPEIWDDKYFSLEERLQLNDVKVTLIDDKRLCKAGKLSITHGHLIMRGFFSPVNSARGVYMKAKQSTVIGHVHKVSTHSETDMDGKVITTWSAGSLCETRPDYSPLVSNYQHGFAHVVVERSGEYTVKNFQIINGKLH
jgi:predicted phosphodiesterase